MEVRESMGKGPESTIIKARGISKGIGRGKVLLSREPLSFLGGVDAKTGIVLEAGHPLEGKCVAGRVLVFPRGKGSTVGSYVMLALKKNGVAPAAIINLEAETIIAVGAIISEIPMVDRPEKDIFEVLGEGMEVEVNGGKGRIRIIGNEKG
jgi:predicted aconitase with swiveling domain